MDHEGNPFSEVTGPELDAFAKIKTVVFTPAIYPEDEVGLPDELIRAVLQRVVHDPGKDEETHNDGKR